MAAVLAVLSLLGSFEFPSLGIVLAIGGIACGMAVLWMPASAGRDRVVCKVAIAAALVALAMVALVVVLGST